jgi:hypothetical protein
MPSVVNDVVEVIMIMTIFSLLAVLSYPPTCIIIAQAPIAAGQGCCFTSSTFCLIVRSVTTRGLTPSVFG